MMNDVAAMLRARLGRAVEWRLETVVAQAGATYRGETAR